MSFQADIQTVDCDNCGKELMIDWSGFEGEHVFCKECQEKLQNCILSLCDLCENEDVFGIMFLLGYDREEAEAEIKAYDRYYNPTISDMLIEYGARG